MGRCGRTRKHAHCFNTRIYNRKTLESVSVLLELRLKKRNFCYCRVSSQKQSNDLKRQSQYLRDLYPQYTLIEDIGSKSILHEKGCTPFWDQHSKEISEKLWLPTKTALRDLDSNSSKPSLKEQEDTSPSSITRCINPKKRNSLKTSLPSSMYSTAVKWEKDATTVVRNHKVKIYPTQTQRHILKQWLGTYRYVYNRSSILTQSHIKHGSELSF